MPDQTAKTEPLDLLGKLLMQDLRDTSIEICKGLTEGKFESPNHQAMQHLISHLSNADKDVLIKCVAYCIDGGINDFLYELDKKCREPADVQLSVKGQNVAELTPMLHRELYGSNGWKAKFSTHVE